MILIPSDMKGLLKSITRSRMEEMVRGAMAKSASCEIQVQQRYRGSHRVGAPGAGRVPTPEVCTVHDEPST